MDLIVFSMSMLGLMLAVVVGLADIAKAIRESRTKHKGE